MLQFCFYMKIQHFQAYNNSKKTHKSRYKIKQNKLGKLITLTLIWVGFLGVRFALAEGGKITLSKT